MGKGSIGIKVKMNAYGSKKIYSISIFDIKLQYSSDKINLVKLINPMEIYMKRFFIKVLIIWHEIRVAYRNRNMQHRLGS